MHQRVAEFFVEARGLASLSEHEDQSSPGSEDAFLGTAGPRAGRPGGTHRRGLISLS